MVYIHNYTTIRNVSRLVGKQLNNNGHTIHALDCCHVQTTITESILQCVDEDKAKDTTQGVAVGGDEPTPVGPFQDHHPHSFAYKLVSSLVPDFSKPLVSYRGDDGGEMFVCKLQEEVEQAFQEYIALPNNCQHSLRQNCTPSTLPSTVTCNQPLGGDKVCDHCHIVSAAHSRCNLEYRIPKTGSYI